MPPQKDNYNTMPSTKKQLEEQIADLEKQLADRQAKHLTREQDVMERQAQQEDATQNLTNLINQMKDIDNQGDTRGEHPDPTGGTSHQRIALAVSWAAATGGIPGYFGERALLPQERDLKVVFKSLGINAASAYELFRNRISAIAKIIRMKDKELDGLTASINKEKSPLCPDPGNVFITTQFRQGLDVFIE
uniref:Uncharacterized protein n=1 Tax=Pseudo-nitzschia australis TaxID=44445 RepID=A0A7S4AWK1_9STRA